LTVSIAMNVRLYSNLDKLSDSHEILLELHENTKEKFVSLKESLTSLNNKEVFFDDPKLIPYYKNVNEIMALLENIKNSLEEITIDE
jgi:hypothetical protein